MADSKQTSARSRPKRHGPLWRGRARLAALVVLCLPWAVAHADWEKNETLARGSFLSNVITALAVQGDVIWVGTDRGLAWSANKGAQWQVVDLATATPYAALVRGGAAGIPVWKPLARVARRRRNLVTDLTVSKSDLWAATGFGVCLSRDAGRTWVCFGPEEGLTVEDVFAVAADGNDVWVTTAAGLYHSADRGRHWRALSPPGSPRAAARLPRVMTSISVDTIGGARTLWAGGFEAGPVGDGRPDAFRSTDDGRSWEPVSTGAGAVHGAAGRRMIHGTRLINQNVWAVGRHGVALSYDNGRTWKTFDHRQRLLADEVWDVAKAQNLLWAATDDGLCYSSDSGQTWLPDPVVRGKTTRVAWDGEGLWVATTGGLLHRALRERVWKSFSDRSHVLCAAVTRERGLETLWVGTAGGLCKSRDRGRTWQVFTVADGLPSNYIRDMAADGILLWAATDGGVLRMETAGSSWRAYTKADGLRSNRIREVVADKGVVWAATQAGLSRFAEGQATWRTSEGTMAWQRVTLSADHLYAATYDWSAVKKVRVPSLTLAPSRKPFFHLVRATREGTNWTLLPVDGYPGGALYDMAAIGDALWLATETGVFRSNDAGATWARFDRDVLWGRHALRLAQGPRGQLLVETRSRDPASAPGILSATQDSGRTWGTVDGRLPGVALALLAHEKELICGTPDGLYLNRSPRLLSGRPLHHSWLRLSYLAASQARRDRMGTVSAVDPYGFTGPSLWLGSRGAGAMERGFPPVEAGFPGVAEGGRRWTRDPWKAASAPGKPGLLDNVVQSILCTSRGVWFGTRAGISLFDRLDGWRPVPIKLPEIKSQDVGAGMRFLDELWFGTPHGIAVYHPRKRTWRAIHAGNSPLPSDGVRALATDGDAVWAGCERGAFQFEPPEVPHEGGGQWHSLRLAERVNQIAVGRTGVYLATDGGLYRYDKTRQHVRHYHRGNSALDGNSVTHVLLHGPEVWVAVRETGTVRKLLEDPKEQALGPTSRVAAPLRAKPEHVVIVVNWDSPDSVRVAEYYRMRRGIPRGNMCGVRCSLRESISRTEFEETIRKPVWRFLQDTGLGQRARFLVTTYGIPLTIRHEPRVKRRYRNTDINGASVDSELCVLARRHRQAGALPNLYLYRDEPFDARRFGTLLVTRLDGPAPQVVMALIDRALKAEQSQSFDSAGQACFDLDPTHNRGAALVDQAIESNYRYLARQSRLRGRLVIERTGQALARPDEAKDTFFYLGWSGNRYRPGVFRWRPGAVAVHVNSFSAKSVRQPGSCWVAGALADGLTCTIGAVEEPLSAGLNAIDHLYRYLHSGYTWAESAYMSIRFHSWQTVVIGDPLYRPFRPPG